jgi:hypothetical protein
MNPAVLADVEMEVESELDVIGEIRLRTWARRNYVPESDRDDTWHPVILDEMGRIDLEGANA